MWTMENSQNCLNKFTYGWEIKNLCYSTLQTGQFIDSPKFSIPQFGNTTWYLRLYPQGITEESKDYISCFMCREEDEGPENVAVEYSISLSSREKNYALSSKHHFERNSNWGYSNFLSHYDKDYDHYRHSLTITWELLICELRNSCDIGNSLPSTLGSIGNQINTGTNQIYTVECNRNEITVPIKCFAQTKIEYDTKSIQKHINFLHSCVNSREEIPIVLPEKYPSLLVELQSDSCGRIDLKVRVIDEEIENSLLVSCKLSVAGKAEEFSQLLDKKHLFIAGKKLQVWRIMENFDNPELKDFSKLKDFLMDELNLKLDFAFSFGDISSRLLNVKYVTIPHHSTRSIEYRVANNLFRLYKEKKLCDVVLKVSSKTFDVHKAILGAMSPVFAAMFSNGMSENKTCVVNILDLDEETVDKMVSFMYTGSLKELEYRSAKKLFVAADKYEILPLLHFCRNFMISHATAENIYGILLIADDHSDLKLQKKLVKFIKLNKDIILNSAAWKDLEVKNSKFAAKILRKVCLLNKRNITLF